jgi:hypothetical protein
MIHLGRIWGKNLAVQAIVPEEKMPDRRLPKNPIEEI